MPKEFWVGTKCKRCKKDILILEKQILIDNRCPYCGRENKEWFLTKAKKQQINKKNT